MFTDYLIIKNDIRIFYKVYGSKNESQKELNPNQPTLIFLHGGPGVVDHSLYESFWAQFSGTEIMESNLQVIFIDHRGCGRSYYDKKGVRDYGDKSRWNLKQWGKDVYTFFTTFKIQKPIIAGVSFGGVVAMSCAIQFPTILGGLILCDTDAYFDLKEITKQFANKVKIKGGDENKITTVCEIVNKMFTNTTAQTYADYVRICIPYCAFNSYDPDIIANCVKNEESAYIYNTNELIHYNFLPDLKNIECQILLIAGDQNPIHNAESAKKTALAIQPNKLNFKLFRGAGSPVYADRRNEVVSSIHQFFDKLSSLFQEDKKTKSKRSFLKSSLSHKNTLVSLMMSNILALHSTQRPK